MVVGLNYLSLNREYCGYSGFNPCLLESGHTTDYALVSLPEPEAIIDRGVAGVNGWYDAFIMPKAVCGTSNKVINLRKSVSSIGPSL